jgi:hypothetical protein
MADRHLEIYWEDPDLFESLIKHLDTFATRHAKRYVEELAAFARFRLIMNVPKGESLYLLRHVDASPVRYQAGGRSSENIAGGGEYVAIVGIKQGSSFHPLYVHRGTGIYDVRPGSLRQPIRPRADRAYQVYIIAPGPRQGMKRRAGHGRRAAITFQKRGEPRKFRRWVRGQRPQPFMYYTFNQARLYAGARLLTLGNQITTPLR